MGSLIFKPAGGFIETAVVACGGAAVYLSTALTQGSSVTSLATSNGGSGIPNAVQSGDLIAVQFEGNVQVFSASGAASAGATSIGVTSEEANFSYPIGSTVKDLGNPVLSQIRWPGAERHYTFMPGVSQEVPPEDFAMIEAELQALQGLAATPNAPAVAYTGTAGTTTYGYEVAANVLGGDTPLSSEGSTTTGTTSLTATNFATVTKPTSMPTNAQGWRVIRVAGGSAQNVDISGVVPVATATFKDTGIAGTSYTPTTGGAPTVDFVGQGPQDQ